jgi:hypothetical protein
MDMTHNRIRVARALVLAIAAMLSIACAAPTKASKTVVKTPNGDDYVCESEVPVGMAISRMVCRRQADIDEEREQTRREMYRPLNRPARF